MHLVNGAPFLNITYLFISFVSFAASSAPAAVIVIFSLTSIYTSLQSHFLIFSYYIIILMLYHQQFSDFLLEIYIFL